MGILKHWVIMITLFVVQGCSSSSDMTQESMAMTGTNANVTGGGIEVSNESDPLGGRTTGDDAQPVGGVSASIMGGVRDEPPAATMDGLPSDEEVAGNEPADADCQVNADCELGTVCDVATSQCILGCRGDDECDQAEQCNAAGLCTTVSCLADDDCPQGTFCGNASCLVGCRLGEPCPDDPDGRPRGCDPSSHLCATLIPCCDDDLCTPQPPGACLQPGCTDDSQCQGRQTCNQSGQCSEPSICIDDADCQAGRICTDGSCAAPCRENADCPGTRACINGRCPEPNMCFSELDCDSGRLCSGQTCRDACTADTCPGNQTCNVTTGLCAEAVICMADDDCRGSRRCHLGQCAAICLMDADCPNARICVGGVCAEPAICFGDADCDPGNICIDETCKPSCQTAACAGTQTCEADGRCRESDTCENVDDCLGDRLCYEGVCTDRCAENADCPGRRDCDEASGICLEPSRCFGNDDCDTGRICLGGTCVDRCEDFGCPGRQECHVDGMCLEPAQCINDIDCLGSRRCGGGICLDECSENADCDGARRCDSELGYCVEPTVCTLDVDCNTGRLCVGGSCKTPCQDGDACPAGEQCDGSYCALTVPCTENDECPEVQICRSGTCQTPQCFESNECDDACIEGICTITPSVSCDACSNDLICQGGVCAASGLCTADAQCSESRPVCLRNGRCGDCRQDQDCPSNAQYCEEGRCILAAACNGETVCPGTRTCVNNRCTAVACDGDYFDMNPPGPLAARVYSELILCDNETDRFQVDLEAGDGLLARIIDIENVGLRLTMEVDDRPRQTSDGPGLAEVVGLAAAPYYRRASIRIDGPEGQSAPYTLMLERIDDQRCPPDVFEGPLGNDTIGEANVLEEGQTLLRLCPGETDVLGIDLPAGVRMSVDADRLTEGTLLMTLLGESGNIISGPASRIEKSIAADGRYFLSLQGNGVQAAGLDTIIAVSVEGDVGGLGPVCADTPTVAAGDAVTVTPFGDIMRFESECGIGMRSDSVLRLALENESRVRFTSPSRRDTVFALRSLCAPESDFEQTCATSDEFMLVGPGDWYAVIRHEGGDPFDVDVAIVPTTCNDNSDCDARTSCTVDGCLPICGNAEDYSCSGNQSCDDGICTEPDNCSDDADCVGRRLCMDGQCAGPN